jgi:hypothetical protein
MLGDEVIYALSPSAKDTSSDVMFVLKVVSANICGDPLKDCVGDMCRGE